MIDDEQVTRTERSWQSSSGAPPGSERCPLLTKGSSPVKPKVIHAKSPRFEDTVRAHHLERPRTLRGETSRGRSVVRSDARGRCGHCSGFCDPSGRCDVLRVRPGMVWRRFRSKFGKGMRRCSALGASCRTQMRTARGFRHRPPKDRSSISPPKKTGPRPTVASVLFD